MNMSLDVQFKLRPATVRDFKIETPNGGFRKIGKDFFVRNADQKIESYRIEASTDSTRIAALIEKGEVFVIDEDYETVFLPQTKIIHGAIGPICDNGCIGKSQCSGLCTKTNQ